MKSPLLRAFFTPHVHQRLRKRPPRCTLDCGFKTPESPALRGFVGGLRALATAALYLVLLSNGLRHSKNLPVKFGFSSKTVPANIVQKLSAHSLLKSVFFRISTSLTNGPRSLSLPKVGTPSASPKGSHTAAHTAKHGAFRMGWYHYPRSVPHVHKHPRAGYQNSKLCRFWVLAGGTPEERREPSEQRCAYARRCSEASRPRWAAWSFFFCRNCGLYAMRSGSFRVCETWEVSLPSACFACCRNAGRPLVKAANLPFSEVG